MKYELCIVFDRRFVQMIVKIVELQRYVALREPWNLMFAWKWIVIRKS